MLRRPLIAPLLTLATLLLSTGCALELRPSTPAVIRVAEPSEDPLYDRRFAPSPDPLLSEGEYSLPVHAAPQVIPLGDRAPATLRGEVPARAGHPPAR